MRKHIKPVESGIPIHDYSIRTVLKGGKIIRLADGREGYLVNAKLHNKIIVIINKKRLYFSDKTPYSVIDHHPEPKRMNIERKSLPREELRHYVIRQTEHR